MTIVAVDLRTNDPVAGTDVPATGHIEVTTVYRYHVDAPDQGPDDYVVVPDRVSVPLVEGRATLVLPATVPDGENGPAAYLISEVLETNTGQTNYYLIPDTENVDYGDLVPVQWGTFAPSGEPEEAWWVALQNLQDEVDELELDGGQGPPGPKGDQGDPGPKGDTGDEGPEGLQGPAGADGAPGVDGVDGAQGPKGDTGDTGPKGDQGDEGPQGEQGIQGIQGAKGDPGDPGANGADGADGFGTGLTPLQAREAMKIFVLEPTDPDGTDPEAIYFRKV